VKKLFAAGSLCLMFLAPLGAAGNPIVGYISDTKCAISGAKKAKTAAEWIKPEAFERCVKECVKGGSEAVFVTEDNKILKLDTASAAKITPFLGHKVRVTGSVATDTITIDSITALELK
jgi:hypothetical protein